jgi:hypothetical protein
LGGFVGTRGSVSLPRLFFPRFQLWEENHIADALLPEEHDAEAIDADADAAGGGHSVFEGGEKIFVQLLLFAAGLFLEAFALFDGVVLFSVRGGNFLAVDAALEDLHAIGLIGGKLGERHKLFG